MNWTKREIALLLLKRLLKRCSCIIFGQIHINWCAFKTNKSFFSCLPWANSLWLVNDCITALDLKGRWSPCLQSILGQFFWSLIFDMSIFGWKHHRNDWYMLDYSPYCTSRVIFICAVQAESILHKRRLFYKTRYKTITEEIPLKGQSPVPRCCKYWQFYLRVFPLFSFSKCSTLDLKLEIIL